MDRGEKINALATLILAFILGISQVYLAIQNNELNNKVYQLQETSLRADISILVNPIKEENWTFTTNGDTYFMISGMLFNEGSRNTKITKLEVSVKYNFSNGEQYTDPISNYKHYLYLEKDVLSSKEGTLFNFSGSVRPFIVVNPNSGQVMGVYNSRPDMIIVLVWHNDGKGEQLSYNSIP